MRYATLCSGIEAPSVAWKPLGWKAAWFSETEPFCCSVLAHHYHEVPNLGDCTKITEEEIKRLGPVDLICGGTPCQGFSVAGQRKGLGDPRSRLAIRFCELVAIARPLWVVWENVPGVLSSAGYRDFSAFLAELEKCGYDLAWRVLDAQYFGVPQRRRRVFVVGYFGDWRRAAAVLFEWASMCGNPPPSQETGEEIAPTISSRTKGGGGLGTDFDCDGGLVANCLQERYRKGPDSGRTSTNVGPLGTMLADNGNVQSGVPFPQGVRRLTPRECARLQGFPDDYLDIIHKAKPASDSAKYKALGNSMTVPLMRWIGERIEIVENQGGL